MLKINNKLDYNIIKRLARAEKFGISKSRYAKTTVSAHLQQTPDIKNMNRYIRQIERFTKAVLKKIQHKEIKKFDIEENIVNSTIDKLLTIDSYSKGFNEEKATIVRDMLHSSRNIVNHFKLFNIETFEELAADKNFPSQQLKEKTIVYTRNKFVELIKGIKKYTNFLSKGIDNCDDPLCILKMAKSSFSKEIKRKGIKITVENSGEIKKIKLKGENNHYPLYCITENLLGNAVKYTPKGGKINIKYEIGNVKNQKILKFFIKDSGIGIPENEWETVFNGFRASNALKSNISGTGYGLSRTNKIIKNLGGKIWVNSSSTTGKTGTEIVGYLPIK